MRHLLACLCGVLFGFTFIVGCGPDSEYVPPEPEEDLRLLAWGDYSAINPGIIMFDEGAPDDPSDDKTVDIANGAGQIYYFTVATTLPLCFPASDPGDRPPEILAEKVGDWQEAPCAEVSFCADNDITTGLCGNFYTALPPE